MKRIKKFLHHTARRTIRDGSNWAYGLHRIRATKKLSYPEADLFIHMVTCHRDLEMALWCLKSFTFFSGISPSITIHDDGTLTDADIEVLNKHLDRCQVIRKSNADIKMDEALKDYPHCLKMRRVPNLPFTLKLLDSWVFSSSDQIVLLDSDILFFQRPTEFLDCVKRNQPCFNSDYQNSYSASLQELNRLGFFVLEKVNSGLFLLRRDQYDLNLVERFFSSIETVTAKTSKVIKFEQTVHTILLTRAKAHRLSDAYQISRQKITEATVSHHFVNDGSREHFARKGIRALKRRGIFTKLIA